MDITCVMSIFDEPPWMVERAIKSMETQTYPIKKMVIVVDKPDNCTLIQWVKEYALTSPLSIQVEVNSQNRGLAYSLNRGFQVADTEVICRMDADDESLPMRIEKTVSLLEKGADIASTAVTVVDECGKAIEHQRELPCSYMAIKRINKYSACVFHPTWLLKKSVWEAIGGYRESMKAAQDYDFIMRALKHGYKIQSVKEHLLNYTVRAKSISGNKVAMQMFLSIYAQNNVYRAKEFEEGIINNIECGKCKDYEAFKKYFAPFLSKNGMDKIRFGFMGTIRSSYFRRYITNTIKQKVLRKYYIAIEK